MKIKSLGDLVVGKHNPVRHCNGLVPRVVGARLPCASGWRPEFYELLVLNLFS